MKKTNIFLVEDDESFGAVLQSYLEMNDYSVTWLREGSQALELFNANAYDICVLDIMLPQTDGFEVARHIKNLQPEMPMIFLTARALKKDVLYGYDLGADDYITKPFDSDVLLCKLRAILQRRRNPPDEKARVIIGRYTYEPDRRILKKADSSRKLSPKEGHLLQLLAAHENTVVDRHKALNQIWGQDDYFSGRSMDVYITRLRKYLKEDESVSIENVHGSGYVLRIEGGHK